ncbi:hypothetical protein SSX86_007515 [Deinandra increscens subsp. villosa]|uniref:ZF-HD dimerization-type domain-containing protein n=1 Tax=Deinandra increscens subsp. villosa TaxID=3103831 RepID=A0AAP0DEU9_9ASTR
MTKIRVVLKREEPPSTNSANSSNTMGVHVRYGECQRNHAANVGGYAVDGCREFMAQREEEEGTEASLTCAACGCHRNFHRRVVENDQEGFDRSNVFEVIMELALPRSNVYKGLPPQLWDGVVFNAIGGKFGTIIHQPAADLNDCNMAKNCVGIMVNCTQKVEGSILVFWNDRSFECWVVEMHGDWEPDFIAKITSLPPPMDRMTVSPEVNMTEVTGEMAGVDEKTGQLKGTEESVEPKFPRVMAAIGSLHAWVGGEDDW